MEVTELNEHMSRNNELLKSLTHSLSPLTWSRRGDMIDTSYDSERQAGLSSANLVRVGLSSLVHSFRLSAQHLTCLPRFLPPSRVPCSTVLARLLWREMWPNHASFHLFTIPYRFSCCPARAFIPLCTNSFVLRSFHDIPYMRL